MFGGWRSCPCVRAGLRVVPDGVIGMQSRSRQEVDWDTAVRDHNARVVASLLALSVPIHQADELASQAWARLIEQERAGELTEIRLPCLLYTSDAADERSSVD